MESVFEASEVIDSMMPYTSNFGDSAYDTGYERYGYAIGKVLPYSNYLRIIVVLIIAILLERRKIRLKYLLTNS